MTVSRGSRKGIFYGWWVALALFAVLTLSSGTGFYSLGIFLKPLMGEFGWSRALASSYITVFFLVMGICAPVVGNLTERFGARRVIATGCVLAGCGLLLLSTTQNIWQLYRYCALMAVGQACASLVPAGTLVSNWFQKKRGTVMGLTTAGLGVGGLVLAPVVGALVVNPGWRWTFVLMGLAMLLLGFPLSALFIRSKPQDMGLLPDGEISSVEGRNAPVPVPHSSRRPPATDRVWTFSQALRNVTFWIIAGAFVMAVTGSMGVLQHQVALLTDKGISPTTAAAALGLTGGFSVIGKISLGYLTDRVACRYVVALSFLLQLVGLVILTVAPSVAWVWLFVVLFGLGMGSVPTLRPLLVGECFGLTAFAFIYGVVVGLVEIGSAVGPVLSGYIFDVTQSYNLAFVIYCLMFVVAIVVVSFARPTRRLGSP